MNLKFKLSPSLQVPDITILSAGEIVGFDTSIEDLLKKDKLVLRVGSDEFRCVIDPPRVKELIS